MHKVRSPDGTEIAYEARGHGPPLVMVHGSSLDHARWGSCVGRLAEHFTLLMVDRRGRGASGDAPVYAIQREFEDVAAVVDSVGRPTHLLGHSYGAVCSLEAARLTAGIEKLVLYEPPLPLGDPGPMFGADIPEQLDELLRRGDREGVVELFLREVVRVSEPEMQALRRSSTWQVRLRAAHTLPREIRMAEGYRFDASLFSKVRTPTLFLLGSESPRLMHDSTVAASAALQNSRVELLPGQGHAAMTTAPAMFLDKVLAFLEDGAG
ncbi:MAG TPA: alpha/beta hydrolase [Polyangia bacterium]